LVVAANCNQEEQAINIFEAMYPFLPLGSLSTNIKHPARVGTEVENGFDDASGFETRIEDILVSWNIILGEKAVDVLEVASRQFSESRNSILESKTYQDKLSCNANSCPRFITL
jgi:hypothetical protein